MKKIIFFFSIILFCIPLFGQDDFDEVRIYFDASYKTGGIANLIEIPEDSLRKNAEIFIRNTSQVELLKWNIILNDLTKKSTSLKREHFECVFVIDFLNKKERVHTIGLNKFGDFRIDGTPLQFEKDEIVWKQLNYYRKIFLQLDLAVEKSKK